ncbi:MAG TPA: energy transducer TonB [Caulobacteraceae bacterium]|nr:energy transducer TonB [Caulobacteraceae bacterium]
MLPFLVLLLAADLVVTTPPPPQKVPERGCTLMPGAYWRWSVDPATLLSAYPESERAKVEKGVTMMRCRLNPDHSVRDCVVTSESPQGSGFGAASISIESKLMLNYANVDLNEPVCVILDWSPTAVSFTNVGVISAPHWVRRPNSDELRRTYPRRALEGGVNGHSVMECEADAQGTLQNCKSIEESPDGFGFGDAELKLAKYFKLSPTTSDGKSVAGAHIRIPLQWRLVG